MCPSMQLGPLVGSLLDELCGVRALHPSPQAVLGCAMGSSLSCCPPCGSQLPGSLGALAIFPGQAGASSLLTPFVVGTSSLGDSVLGLVGQVFPQQSAGGVAGVAYCRPCLCSVVGRGLLEPSAWQCASGRGFLSSGAPSDVCLVSGEAGVLRGAGPGLWAPSPHVLFPLWLSALSFCACYRASLSRAALCQHADVFPQVASESPPAVRAVGGGRGQEQPKWTVSPASASVLWGLALPLGVYSVGRWRVEECPKPGSWPCAGAAALCFTTMPQGYTLCPALLGACCTVGVDCW